MTTVRRVFDMADQSEAAKRRLLLEAVRAGQQVRIRALGVSMMPAIWPGDVLVIEACAIDQIQPGQVAVFERQERIFAHRVVARTVRDGATLLVTRGDRMEKEDPDVSTQELLGRVAMLERAGREIRIAEHVGVAEKLARQVVRFDKGVAIFLALARLLGKTEYPMNVRQGDNEQLPRAI